MKKKYRNITVNDQEYAWSVNLHDDECGLPFTKIKVWKDRKIIIERDINDNGLTEASSITPSMISRIITQYENSL
jgi:hypothetical protein